MIISTPCFKREPNFHQMAPNHREDWKSISFAQAAKPMKQIRTGHLTNLEIKQLVLFNCVSKASFLSSSRVFTVVQMNATFLLLLNMLTPC